MVLPNRIARAAQAGDVAAVEAWLDAGNDVNDRSNQDNNHDTLLFHCFGTPSARDRLITYFIPSALTASHTDLVRLLIERGADVNALEITRDGGISPASPLHCACDRIGDLSADAVSLLLDAKADVHYRTRDAPPEDDAYPEITPLGRTLFHFHNQSSWVKHPTALRIVTMLLRAGASLDAVCEERTAEMELRGAEEANPNLRHNSTFVQIKALISGVRAAGSWKSYCRLPHKSVLRLRSLITRGRARERLAATPAIKFILRRADNGVLWTILSFWQATN